MLSETTTGIPESLEVEEEISTTVFPDIPEDTEEVVEGKQSASGSKLAGNSTEQKNSILSLHDRVYLHLKEVSNDEINLRVHSVSR